PRFARTTTAIHGPRGGIDGVHGRRFVTATGRGEAAPPPAIGPRGGEARRPRRGALRLRDVPVPDDERATGTFGPGTLAALRSWQAAAHLEPSGVLDERTLAPL